jgi:glycosyltransferase involved in cell wall biosynthesis
MLQRGSTGEPLRVPTAETVEGVPIRRVAAWPARRDYFFAPAIAGVIARERPDIVHCQGIHTFVAPLAMLAAWYHRIPYVVTFHTGGHTSGLRNAVRGLQWRLLRPLLARAARLIGVSRFEAASFRDGLGFPAERFTVISNGAQLPATPAMPAMSDDAPLIVSIGRLERYKGHHRVIAALPLLRERFPQTRLLILGGGPYEAALREQAAGLGIADAVEIRRIPPADREAMAATLAGAAVVALLSDYEAHPIAVMEALALGRPVLVAATSGLQELADDGLARAIPLDATPDQAAAALAEQIREPLRPAGFTLPTWDDCAAQLLAVYRRVADERAARLVTREGAYGDAA